MSHPVRITVLKKSFREDFVDSYTEADLWHPCDLFYEGQTFVSDGWMPQEFCSWAWSDILKYVVTLARGGNMRGVKPGTFVTCCTDGFRPVFFKLERVEGGQSA